MFKNLFVNKKYDEAIIEIKKFLQTDMNNYSLWYSLFLAENNDYLKFDIDYINNSLAFNKALELANDAKKRQLSIEYNFYVYISKYKNINALFKYAQYNDPINFYNIFIDIIYKRDLDNILLNFEYIKDFIMNYCNEYKDNNELLKLFINYLCLVLDFPDLYKALYKENEIDNIYEIKNSIILLYEDSLRDLANLDISYNEDDFEIENNILIKYKGKSSRVIIPNNVIEIGDNAFADNHYLKEVIFSKNVKKIGHEAFESCINISAMILNDSLEIIEYGAFRGLSSLERITLPNNIKVLEQHTFHGCNLKKLSLPKNLIEIKMLALVGCNSLLSLEIFDKVAIIENDAFECYKLAEVYNYSSIDVKKYFNNVKYILKENERSKIKYTKDGYVLIYDTLTEMYTMIDYIGYESILELPYDFSGIKYSISGYCFSKNPNIVKVIVPEGINRIDISTFEQCDRLLSVYLPSSVEYIDDYAFYDSFALVEVYGISKILEEEDFVIENVNVHYDEYNDSILIEIDDFYFIKKDYEYYLVLYNGIKTDVILPKNVNDNLYSIRYRSLNNKNIHSILMYDIKMIDCICNFNLVNVRIDGNVERFNYHAFSRCENLKSVIINGNVKYIDSYDVYGAFSDCNLLEEIIINGDVKYVEKNAFIRLPSLKRFEINGFVEDFKQNFLDCDNYKEIYIKDSCNIGYLHGNFKRIVVQNCINEFSGFEPNDNVELYLGSGPKILTNCDYLNNDINITLNNNIIKIDYKYNEESDLERINFLGTFKEFKKIRFADSTLFSNKTLDKLLEIVNYIKE